MTKSKSASPEDRENIDRPAQQNQSGQSPADERSASSKSEAQPRAETYKIINPALLIIGIILIIFLVFALA